MSLLSAPRPLIEPLVQGAYQQETSVVHPAGNDEAESNWTDVISPLEKGEKVSRNPFLVF